MKIQGRKGKFRPQNPEKYRGNPTGIIYRSTWESKFMRYLDRHRNVLKWASEEQFMVVPYRNPFDKSVHRYFPDFWLKQINTEGEYEEFLIEIKPFHQTVLPVKGRKKTKTFMRESATYKINVAKWDAAEKVCNKRGWVFKILTQKELGIRH